MIDEKQKAESIVECKKWLAQYAGPPQFLMFYKAVNPAFGQPIPDIPLRTEEEFKTLQAELPHNYPPSLMYEEWAQKTYEMEYAEAESLAGIMWMVLRAAVDTVNDPIIEKIQQLDIFAAWIIPEYKWS